jgi:hypothetical protein
MPRSLLPASPALMFVLLLLGASPLGAQTFWVATDGDDQPARGSESQPWRSITYALDRVPDAEH